MYGNMIMCGNMIVNIRKLQAVVVPDSKRESPSGIGRGPV
jgi:hypothetical protein